MLDWPDNGTFNRPFAADLLGEKFQYPAARGILKKSGASPMRFPPIVDTRPRHWKINFDGLFTDSNNDGLGKPQPLQNVSYQIKLS